MCVIFYIAHLGVRYEIYTLALPFDLRCQSGIYTYIHTCSVGFTVIPPVIKKHPMSVDRDIQLFTNFTNHTLTCEADGASSYNWERQNDVIPSDSIGVNTNTLTLINLQPEDAGNYRCVAANSTGSSRSNYAVITMMSKSNHIMILLYIEYIYIYISLSTVVLNSREIYIYTFHRLTL